MGELTDPVVPVPKITTIEEAIARAKEISYPVLVTPILGGPKARHHIVNNDKELGAIFNEAFAASTYEARVDMVHLPLIKRDGEMVAPESRSYTPTDT